MKIWNISFDRLNGLFDDTINDICHQVQAFATSNESYTYSGMLREDDHKQFFQAMELELADHEERNHWTLMERKDLPLGTMVTFTKGEAYSNNQDVTA